MRIAHLSRTAVAVVGIVVAAAVVITLAWLRPLPGGTDDSVASEPAATSKSPAEVKRETAQAAYSQQSWNAVDQVAASKERLAKLLATPQPQRRPASQAVPAELVAGLGAQADGNCPAVTNSNNQPGSDQIQLSLSSGQSFLVGTGTANLAQGGCNSLISQALTQVQVFVAVGSDVAVCIKTTASTSGPNACNSSGDTVLTKNGVYGAASPVTTISILDTTNFLMQFNTCPGCNLQGAGLSGITLAPKADLSGADLSGAVIYNSDFPQAILTKTKFNVFNGQQTEIAMTDIQNATLIGTTFEGADFYQADFTGSAFNCPQFTDTVITGVQFDDTTWTSGCANPQFSSVVMNLDSLALDDWPNLYVADSSVYTDLTTYQSMEGQTLTGLRFVNSTFLGRPPSFKNTNFGGTTLDKSVFYLSNLQGAQFGTVNSVQTSMVGTDFSNTMLEAANFNGSLAAANFDSAYLANATFVGANLSSGMNNAAFTKADVHGVDFSGVTSSNSLGSGVDFTGAYLWPGTNSTNFNGATLPGANFEYALLAGTSFSGQADLTGADFSNAQCIMCDFTDTKLDQSKFESAYIYGSTYGGATLQGANFTNAACCSSGTWIFPAPSNAAAPNTAYHDDPNSPDLSGAEFSGVAACPSGAPGQNGTGCQNQVTPIVQPTANPACVSAGGSFGGSYCPADITLLGGNGTQGLAGGGTGDDDKALDAEFDSPARVMLSKKTGELLISDTGNHMVRAISGLSAQEPQIANLAGTGTAGDSGDGGAATSAELSTPQGLAEYPATGTSQAGSIAIADSGSNNVRLLSPDYSSISLYAGSGTACAEPVGSCGDGQIAPNAELSAPQGVWFAPSGDLYIADTGNHKIRKVDATTHLISTYAGNGSSTAPSSPVSNSGDCQNGVPATSVGMDSPTDITGDLMGNVYVVDQGATQVYQIDPNGCLTIPDTGLTSPTAIVTDAQGSVFVADPGQNAIVSASAWGILAPSIGTGTAGNTGNGGPAASAELNAPQGLASSSGGVIYIADTGNQQIRLAQPPG